MMNHLSPVFVRFAQPPLAAMLVALLFGCDAKIDVKSMGVAPGEVFVLDEGGQNGDTGWWPSITFDANNRFHLTYCDKYHGDLNYIYETDEGFHKETILARGAVGKYTSIDISPEGDVGVLFYDQDRKQLRFAFRAHDSDTFGFEKVIGGLEAGMAARLELRSAGQAEAYFYVSTGKFVRANRHGDKDWKIKIITEATGGFSAITSVRHRADKHWVSFLDANFDQTRLMFGKAGTKGKSYALDVVANEDGPGWYSAMFFDSKGQPHIAYNQIMTQQMRLAQYASNGEWESKRLYKPIGTLTGTTNADDTIWFIAFQAIGGDFGTQARLHYLVRHRENWREFLVDDAAPVGEYLSAAIDGNNRVALAYYSKPLRGLKLYLGPLQ